MVYLRLNHPKGDGHLGGDEIFISVLLTGLPMNLRKVMELIFPKDSMGLQRLKEAAERGLKKNYLLQNKRI
ncbi:MAG: hypothetical protein Ct9H300mP2_3800 [Candidatus Neomarinimicrobiota bacterium]|nr:MAG: hypothetical protein Ct9H300mP2_3800 [Candidatus Neomarinimicrobiota bacterium]